MGHHINDLGQFQSDKFPNLAPDKVVISLKDPRTWAGLRAIAIEYCTDREEREFGNDLLDRLIVLINKEEGKKI